MRRVAAPLLLALLLPVAGCSNNIGRDTGRTTDDSVPTPSGSPQPGLSTVTPSVTPTPNGPAPSGFPTP